MIDLGQVLAAAALENDSLRGLSVETEHDRLEKAGFASPVESTEEVTVELTLRVGFGKLNSVLARVDLEVIDDHLFDVHGSESTFRDVIDDLMQGWKQSASSPHLVVCILLADHAKNNLRWDAVLFGDLVQDGQLVMGVAACLRFVW